MFRRVPLSIIRSLVLYIQQYEHNQDGTQFRPDYARKLSADVYDIPLLLMVDRGTVQNM